MEKWHTRSAECGMTSYRVRRVFEADWSNRDCADSVRLSYDGRSVSNSPDEMSNDRQDSPKTSGYLRFDLREFDVSLGRQPQIVRIGSRRLTLDGEGPSSGDVFGRADRD